VTPQKKVHTILSSITTTFINNESWDSYRNVTENNAQSMLEIKQQLPAESKRAAQNIPKLQ